MFLTVKIALPEARRGSANDLRKILSIKRCMTV
jgi:hypothetical protein